MRAYLNKAMSSKTPPRILLPTDSVAQVRKKDDALKDGYSIDTDANLKLADAHGGARPPESKNTTLMQVKNVSTLTSTNGLGWSPPPVRVPYAEFPTSALVLGIYLVDRSLLPALTALGLITPDGCLA